jgi:hypothetical protein
MDLRCHQTCGCVEFGTNREYGLYVLGAATLETLVTKRNRRTSSDFTWDAKNFPVRTVNTLCCKKPAEGCHLGYRYILVIAHVVLNAADTFRELLWPTRQQHRIFDQQLLFETSDPERQNDHPDFDVDITVPPFSILSQ